MGVVGLVNRDGNGVWVCGVFGGAGSGCNFVYMCIYNYTEGGSRLEEVNGMFIY